MSEISQFLLIKVRVPSRTFYALLAHRCPSLACTALPCRISIYEEGEKTVLATLKPTAPPAIFNVPQLEQVEQEVEGTILNIMNEMAG